MGDAIVVGANGADCDVRGETTNAAGGSKGGGRGEDTSTKLELFLGIEVIGGGRGEENIPVENSEEVDADEVVKGELK
eukprot:CAMPEP_0201498098 /NCGR_PEP_ID=MMETSP0151_2-20130828/69379_1 /ASSEMBLY_ACC=CAM_ASM_000257 /TAXON_ID=200890 /ORGANISM="Paramoeba atlantica, Strain 621/1 / CCAP 1560/9" /LENGTH=77 /DNA_ID=CAMNT_0047889415 /DNA_START=208 /DNA_END=441 /DNA_ORIENTATION=-